MAPSPFSRHSAAPLRSASLRFAPLRSASLLNSTPSEAPAAEEWQDPPPLFCASSYPNTTTFKKAAALQCLKRLKPLNWPSTCFFLKDRLGAQESSGFARSDSARRRPAWATRCPKAAPEKPFQSFHKKRGGKKTGGDFGFRISMASSLLHSASDCDPFLGQDTCRRPQKSVRTK